MRQWLGVAVSQDIGGLVQGTGAQVTGGLADHAQVAGREVVIQCRLLEVAGHGRHYWVLVVKGLGVHHGAVWFLGGKSCSIGAGRWPQWGPA